MEAQVIAAVDRLFADRTRILISHRASALARADIHVRLDQGRFVHDQALAVHHGRPHRGGHDRQRFPGGAVGQSAGRRSFRLRDAEVDIGPAQPDRLGHGSCLLDVVAAHAPAVKFAIAQVFHDRMVTSAVLVAAALDWLAERKVRVINLSLGLRQDRGVLRAACERAVADGIVLCASTPARGEPVYPASYPGVMRMTGDARCALTSSRGLIPGTRIMAGMSVPRCPAWRGPAPAAPT